MYSPKIGRNFGRKGGVKGGKYRFKAIILLSDIYICRKIARDEFSGTMMHVLWAYDDYFWDDDMPGKMKAGRMLKGGCEYAASYFCRHVCLK